MLILIAEEAVVFNKRKALKDPEEYAYSLGIRQLVSILKKLDKYYHDKAKPMVPDQVYDTLRDVLQERSPKNPYLKKVGHEPTTKEGKKSKVSLPYYMPSLNKIKPWTDISNRWYQNNKAPAYIVADKLDGASLLLVYEKNGNIKAYTRGNGSLGQDVSALTPFLNIPKNIKKHLVIRTEAIMSDAVFNKKYAKDIGGEYEANRSMVSGLLNRIKGHEGLKDVKIVAHELIQPSNRKPSQQFAELKALGFTVVPHKLFKEINDELLSTVLKARKSKSKFPMDGLVIMPDKTYRRVASGNPEYAIAFKENTSESMVDVEVKDVIWSVSKDGKLKPRIVITPTKIGGVTVSYTSGFNTYFIEHGYSYKDRLKKIKKKPIGPGAVVKMVRSGDVIPYIFEVVKGANKPKMPDVDYEYGPNKVEIQLSNMETGEGVLAKKMVHFFTKIEAKNIKIGIINRMIEAGLDSIPKILKAKPADFLKIPGFQTRSAEKIHQNIHDALNNMTFSQIGDASGVFGGGIGTKKLDALIKHYPYILEDNTTGKLLVDKLQDVPSFSLKTAQQIAQGLPKLRRFIKITGIKIKKPAVKKPVSKRMSNINVVFSKIRDKGLEQAIILNGGTVSATVNKQVTHLITRGSSFSTKIEKARAMGIKIMDIDDFRTTFNL